MLAGTRSAIRDGNDTLFWTNNWVDSDLRLIDYANTDDVEFDIDCTVASMTNSEGQWDFQRLEKFLPPEAVDMVVGMSPPRASSGSDDWVWGLEKSGMFSIRSAYNIICNHEFAQNPNLWKTVWRWKGPNRITHFLWLAAKEKLLTNEARSRRGLCLGGDCRWCSGEAESTAHVLRDCNFAKAFWQAIGDFDLNTPDWQLNLSEWFQAFLASDNGLRFGIGCWFLWRARNERIFAGSVESAKAIASKALNWEIKVREATNFEANILDSQRKERQIAVAWKAGPPGWIVINSDGSVLGNRGGAAVGGLLRNEDGQCVEAFAMNLGICSITRAEIRGAIEGIRRAWSGGYRKVEVQMDSQAAIAILMDDSASIEH
ncbi:Putative ribonuclease H protein At1g65750 [Linum perenne]